MTEPLDPTLRRQIAAKVWAMMEGLAGGPIPFDPATMAGFDDLPEHERVWWLMVVAIAIKEYDAAAPTGAVH